MKICILTHDGNTSAGWGRFSGQLIDGLRRRGHEVIVLTEQGGAHPILRRGFGVFFSALRAIPYIRTCDAIHALDVYPFGIIAWLANIFFQKPLLLSAQGTYSVAPLYNFRYGLLARFICKGAGTIIAISNYSKSRMLQKVPDARIVVINHGIDLKYWGNTLVSNREDAMITVGAVKKRKGYDYILDAFVRARESIKNLQWWIVGAPDDLQLVNELKKRARELGVEKDITWFENISDEQLRQLYGRARLFILLSQNQDYHFEGFGLVFLEAAASGLPVIGTFGNGIEDAVSAQNGVLVAQNDSEAATQEIIHLLTHSELWQRRSDASLQWALAHDMQKVIDEYEKIYRKALS